MLRRLFGVKCYSVSDKRIFYKYKSELDSRYILANITNSPIGTAWVLAAELKPSDEIRHPPLSGDNLQCVKDIMENLRGVYDLTYEEWEIGFRKDMNLEMNIAQWWFLSGRLAAIKVNMILDEDERQSLFRMMVAIMNNGKEFALSNVAYSGQIEKNKIDLVRRFTCSDKEFA